MARPEPDPRSARESDEDLEELAPDGTGLSGRVEVGEEGDTCHKGTIRAIPGGRRLTRRVTPSGEICTRRSARRAETTAAMGTPNTATRMSTA